MRPDSPPRNPPTRNPPEPTRQPLRLSCARYLGSFHAQGFTLAHFAPGDLPQPILPRPIYPAGFYPGGFNPRKNDIMQPTHYVITPAGHVLASFASLAWAVDYAASLNATLPADWDEKERAWASWARCPYVPSRFTVSTQRDF